MVPYSSLTKIIGYGLIHHIRISLVSPAWYASVTLYHLKSSYLPVFHVHLAVIVNIDVVGVKTIAVVIPTDGVIIPDYGLCMVGAASEIC